MSTNFRRTSTNFSRNLKIFSILCQKLGKIYKKTLKSRTFSHFASWLKKCPQFSPKIPLVSRNPKNIISGYALACYASLVTALRLLFPESHHISRILFGRMPQCSPNHLHKSHYFNLEMEIVSGLFIWVPPETIKFVYIQSVLVCMETWRVTVAFHVLPSND